MGLMDPFNQVTQDFKFRPTVRLFSSTNFVTFCEDLGNDLLTTAYGFVENVFRAWHDLGVQTPSDPTNGNKSGVFWNPHSLDPKNETRSYARSAHYNGAPKTRPNYHLLTGHAVSKIIFDGKTATGVEVSHFL